MSVNVPREVIVDDNETGIRYNGSWLLSNGQNFKSKGINPFSNSLHGTNGKADFSYSFTGSDGLVLGTITNASSNFSSPFVGASGGPPPWQCFLDGVLLPVPQPPDDPDSQNDYSWPLCEWNDVPIQPHTLSVHIDQLDNGQTLWFDELIFVPDPNAVINNSTVYVDHNDPAIQYGDGWSLLNGSHIATSEGSTLTFPFVGTALSWFATIPDEATQIPSSALFSIDDQDPTNTTIVGDIKHKDRPQTQYNKLIYQTPRLPYGSHTLTVVSEGSPDLVVPLILSYLVLDNSELPVSQTTPTDTATSSIPVQTSSLPPSSGSSHHSNFGDKENNSGDLSPKFRVIIGSVIGALAFLALVLLGFLCYRRRQSRRRKQRSAEAGTLPSSLEAKRRVTIQQPPSQQEYPFSQYSTPQLESNGYNFEKRFTHGSSTYGSSRDRPNSLFPVSRLSVLPTKGDPPPDTPRSYRPYMSRFRFSNFSSHSRFTSASSITLLPHSSPRRSSRPLSDDETAIMGSSSRNSDSSGGMKLPHRRPPETTEPPPYTTG